MSELIIWTYEDGVIQAPGGPDEDREAGFTHGGSLVPYFDTKSMQMMTEWTKQAGVFLLGRTTYAMFAASWATPKSTDQCLAIGSSEHSAAEPGR